MFNLGTLSVCLHPILSRAEIALLLDLFTSFLTVSQKITTLSLARVSKYSVRTLHRFFNGQYNWVEMRVRLFNQFLFPSLCKNNVFLLVGDETVEGKSGKWTYGTARFYSSCAQMAIPGICFFGISLVHVESGVSFLMGILQVVYTLMDKQRIAADKVEKAEGKKRAKAGKALPKGRKAGTKNQPKSDIKENDTASYRTFKTLFINVLETLRKFCIGIDIAYLVLDSAYGTYAYALLATSNKLQLISKLKYNAALTFKYSGEQASRGRKRIYGDKVDAHNIPQTHWKETITTEDMRTDIYNFEAYSQQTFGQQLLNIVVLQTTRISDNKVTINIWFSTDLNLDYNLLLDYYSLRFQIEFDFRDAKQHFGFSDFKNYKEKKVTSFANLSFTMCLISKILLEEFRAKLHRPKMGITDLKLIFRTRFTAKNILKLIRENPISIFNDEFCDNLLPNDLIHQDVAA